MGAPPGPNGRDLPLRADSASLQQLSSDQEKVAEGEQREELRPVLREAAVAGLEIPELALEHPERMLDPGPHHGDDPVDVRVDGMQRAALRGLAHDAPEPAGAGERGLPRRADIALVGPH